MTLIFMMAICSQGFAGTLYNCKGTSAKADQLEAVKIIKAARQKIIVSPNSQEIKDALKEYFGLSHEDKDDSILISIVYKNISRIHDKAEHKTDYKCHVDNDSLWCTDTTIAVVPPPKNKVHLCSRYFKKEENKRVGTIIHEWFHLHGGFAINYLPETYCSEAKMENKYNLIRSADQYMLFIYNLALGEGRLKCF